MVNVGRSDDGTLELIRGIDDPRIRILETEWDWSDKIMALGRETMRAMRACRHPGASASRPTKSCTKPGAIELRDRPAGGRGMRGRGPARALPALLRRSRYPRDAPALVSAGSALSRLDPALDIRPFQDAQGFRVGPEDRKSRARETGALMYHYGWARPPRGIHPEERSSPAVLSREGAARSPTAALDTAAAALHRRTSRSLRGTGCANGCRCPASDALPIRFSTGAGSGSICRTDSSG